MKSEEAFGTIFFSHFSPVEGTFLNNPPPILNIVEEVKVLLFLHDVSK